MRKILRKYYHQMMGNYVELISIHLPKTAGTSFENSLKEVYGVRIKTIYHPPDITPLLKMQPVQFEWGYRAVHGHFPANKALLEANPKAKMVTWIRNPIDRVISHYYFWKQIPEGKLGNKNHVYFCQNNLSLTDFVQTPEMRGEVFVYQGYLGKVKGEDFFFIGEMEEYDRDLMRLANLMKWPLLKAHQDNRAKTRKEANKKEIQKIEEVLKEEIQRYQYLKSSIHRS